jgi:hypothetical protein
VTGLVLSACSGEVSEPTDVPTAAAVNAKCPMKPGNDVVEGRTTVFDGETVGFCCPQCKAQFETLSDEEKKAKLSAVRGSR